MRIYRSRPWFLIFPAVACGWCKQEYSRKHSNLIGRPVRRTSFQCLSLSQARNNNDQENDLTADALSLELFKRRKEAVERNVLVNKWQRPPNPFLEPTELVEELLEELRLPSRIGHYSGVRTLLECSTLRWRREVCQFIGAPPNVTNDQVAPTLEAALSRPNNQFAILLGLEDANYEIQFPSDPFLDADEGTCWVECRLRDKTSELLVVLGWSLTQREDDGAWLVDGVDWQDFRDAYRPGIGREEWERICG